MRQRPSSARGIYDDDVESTQSRFRMGRLDHVHIRVPDRAEAARWYAEHLGFEPVDTYDFWATGFEGGPLQISADGGRTMLALFEASEGHPMVPQQTGVAFSVDADTFMSFARVAALRDRQSARRASRAHRSRRLRHVLGVRSRRPVGQPVRAQLLRLRPGQSPSWSRPTRSRSSATGHGNSSRRTSAPRRPSQTEMPPEDRSQLCSDDTRRASSCRVKRRVSTLTLRCEGRPGGAVGR